MSGFLLSHLLWIGTVATVLLLTPSILSRSRPVGSSFAWFLAIFLVPYAGIPLFLVFGDRKMTGRGGKAAFRFMSANSSERSQSSPLEAALTGGGACPCSAGSVEWLADGVTAFNILMREIKAARHTIRISTFILGNDQSGLAFVAALAEKASEGVAVHFLIDDLMFFRAPEAQLKKFTAAGGRYARFMPVLHVPFRGHANLRNHRKMAIFDGATVIAGGMNMAAEYLGPTEKIDRWRDLSVLLRGSVAAACDEIFIADWRQATAQELPPAVPALDATGAIAYLVPSGPDCAGDLIYDAILQCAYSARQRLWFATPYFVPDEALFRALVIAIHRGVDVRIFVPRASNHPLTDLVGAPFLRDLKLAGASVFLYQGKMLHAKAMLVDDDVVGLGSANLDRRSFFLNYEIALLLRDEAAVRRTAAWFEETERLSAPGPAPASRIRRSLESVARLFSPLL